MKRTTANALTKRINRVLAKDHEVIRTSRSRGEHNNLGRYYRLDSYRNAVIDHHVDLCELGKELGVLAPDEQQTRD